MKEAIKISKQGQWSMTKAEKGPQMASPSNPKEGRTRDKKNKKDDSELLYPGIEHGTINKAEDGPHYHVYQDGYKLTDKPMHHNEVVKRWGSVQRVESAGYRLKPAKSSNDVEKQDDDMDAKIRAKIKAKMDEKNFTEVDATRHKIDVDRGNKQATKPKPLLN